MPLVNAAARQAQHNESWLLGFFEQGFRGLEEKQGHVNFGLDLGLEGGKWHSGKRGEYISKACIGNDDDDMGDFLLSKDG